MSVKEHIQYFKDYCESNGLRVTDPRLFVFEIVLKSKTPITAYDVLDALSKKLNKPKPPTAYRALDFLCEHGFVHRIESLNAYVACEEDHHHNGSQFMVCDTCGRVEEIHLCHMPESLQKQVQKSKFRLSHWNAELHGTCGSCS